MVHVSVLKRSVGGDPAAVRARLATYLQEAGAEMTRIQAGASRGAWRQVGKRAAALKAASRAVGALLLGDQCGELENAVVRGDPQGIAQDVQRVAETFAAVEAEVEKLLRSRG